MKRPQGPPPWAGSLGDQGRSGDAALSSLAPVPSPRTGLLRRKNERSPAPSEVLSFAW